MGRQRELRLLRRARAVERELAEVQPIVRAAERYVAEIYAPNIKEPFSIANRRMDLVEIVQRRKAQGDRSAERARAERSPTTRGAAPSPAGESGRSASPARAAGRRAA